MNAQTPLKVIGQGRFIRLVDRDGWEFIDHPGLLGIVVIVAVTAENRLLLVEQYRAPLDARVVELPAGMAGDVDGDESFVAAARRELEEETGYTAERLDRIALGPQSPGRTAFLYSFFRAHAPRRIHAGGGDESEDIVVHEAPLERIDAWLAEREAEGLLIDPKIWAGLYFIRRAGT